MQVLKSGEKRKLSMKSLQNSNQKVPLDLKIFEYRLKNDDFRN